MSDAAGYKYLVVALEIFERKITRFEQLMAELLVELFEKPPNPKKSRDGGLGWRLLAALQESTQSRSGFVRYLHVWETPRDVNLSDAMLLAGATRSYYELNQLNDSETQDFFTAAITYAPVESTDPSKPSGRDALALGAAKPLIVETVDAPADWFALHSWQEAMPELAAEVVQDSHLMLAFALQAESGRLRRYLNFWRPLESAGVTADEAKNAIAPRPIKLLKIAAAHEKYSGVAKPVAGAPDYVQLPYGSVVGSSFQIYKEVAYRPTS